MSFELRNILKRRRIDAKDSAALEAAREVAGTSTGSGEVARKLYKKIPGMIHDATSGAISPETANRQLKNGFINTGVVELAILGLAEEGASFELSKTFVQNTLPAFLSITSISTAGNHPNSARKAVEAVAKQAGQGMVNINSPLCPPYSYGVYNGALRHSSGELKPTIGERFKNSLTALVNVFGPLSEHGVETNVEFSTYTGESGDKRHLVDLGADVLANYRNNPGGLFNALLSAAQEAREQSSDVLGKAGIENQVSSIELNLGSIILGTVNDFKTNFPDANNGIWRQEEEVSDWLNHNLGVGVGWLNFFIEEEAGYRRKQGHIQQEQSPIVPAALAEGLLYLLTCQKAAENDQVVIDMETTTNYMVGSLGHSQGSVIMGKEFDPKNPNDPLSIRQPFNLPE